MQFIPNMIYVRDFFITGFIIWDITSAAICGGWAAPWRRRRPCSCGAPEEFGICGFAAEHASANTASGNVIRKCGVQLVRRGTFAKFDGSETFDAAFYELHLKGDS